MSGPPSRSLPTCRKLLYAAIVVVVVVVGVEGTLRAFGYEGTTAEDLRLTAGFHVNACVWRRDRILGDWFLDAPGGLVRSNPRLLARGMHELHFPRAKEEGEPSFFALGGSTTQGEPWTEREKGFPERLEGLLQQRDPEARWRILDAGVAGLVPQARLGRGLLPGGRTDAWSTRTGRPCIAVQWPRACGTDLRRASRRGIPGSKGWQRSSRGRACSPSRIPVSDPGCARVGLVSVIPA